MSRAFSLVFVLAAVLVAGVTASAQRGNWGRYFTPSFTSNVPYDGKFVFVRMYYDGSSLWSHDYPTGEQNFMKILTTVSNLTAHVESTNVLRFDDPEMFKFPLIYLVEPGGWQLSDQQVEALRAYLRKGGFLVVDDFPSQAWWNFEFQMGRVFPDGRWIDLDATHPIFHAFFEIDSLDIIPQAYNLGGPPVFRALFEDNDPDKRMYAIANYQSDLSEFWEASATGLYIVDDTNEAYKIGVNQFVYGLMH